MRGILRLQSTDGTARAVVTFPPGFWDEFPRASEDRRIDALDVIVSDVQGPYLLQWNSLGPTSAALLDPHDGTYSGTLNFPVTLDWVQNPIAEQVFGATMSIDYRGTLATTVLAAPGQHSVQFPALGTPALTPSTVRQLLFGYRALDGGAKSAMYRWN